MTVDAVHIQMALGTQALTADTKVKSVVQSQNRAPAPAPRQAGRPRCARRSAACRPAPIVTGRAARPHAGDAETE